MWSSGHNDSSWTHIGSSVVLALLIANGLILKWREYKLEKKTEH